VNSAFQKGNSMTTRLSRLSAFLIFASAAVACGSDQPPNTGSGGSSGSGGSVGSGGGSGSGGSVGSGGGSGSGGSVGAGGSTSGGTGGGTGSGGSTGAGGGGAPIGNDYFPFAVGNSWEYDVTETGKSPSKKLNKIVRMEAVGGKSQDAAKMVYRVETTKVATPGQPPGDATISWQLREGSRVVRYREVSCAVGSVVLEAGSVKSCSANEESFWAPARIRIDEMPTGKPLAKDLAWEEKFTENKTTYAPAGSGMGTPTITMETQNWKVLELGVSATSPAGTFQNCLILQKTAMTDMAKKYTFCKGVGKVREEASGQLEALSKFDLAK
jgi:hypothetical protein